MSLAVLPWLYHNNNDIVIRYHHLCRIIFEVVTFDTMTTALSSSNNSTTTASTEMTGRDGETKNSSNDTQFDEVKEDEVVTPTTEDLEKKETI